jgi:putative protease
MHISRQDREMLDKLYIRSERQEGYLHKHNGADMVSISSPAYSKVSEECKQKLAEKYEGRKLKLTADMKLVLRKNEEAGLVVSCKGKEAAVTGAVVQEARKAPLSEEETISRLKKTGDTPFEAGRIETDIDEGIFMPVSAINELRRKSLDRLAGEMLAAYMRKTEPEADTEAETERSVSAKQPYISVTLNTGEQLSAVLDNFRADRLVLPFELFEDKSARDRIRQSGAELYMAMPEIVRQKDIKYIKEMLDKYANEADGAVVSSIDALNLAKKYFKRKQIHADSSVYAMNDLSAGMILEECASFGLCTEQNHKEYREMADANLAELNIYGRTPVMISAGCVLMNTQGCDRKKDTTVLRDDSGRSFPVLLKHKMCYNIILNCVPLSLHKEFFRAYADREYGGFGLRFTTESKSETVSVLRLFEEAMAGRSAECTYDFTRGHYRRGAE